VLYLKMGLPTLGYLVLYYAEYLPTLYYGPLPGNMVALHSVPDQGSVYFLEPWLCCKDENTVHV
jgi:hypothetical protein